MIVLCFVRSVGILNTEICKDRHKDINWISLLKLKAIENTFCSYLKTIIDICSLQKYMTILEYLVEHHFS